MNADLPDAGSFRRELATWLNANADTLTPPHDGYGTLDEELAHYKTVKRALWDADFGRYGWPESVGGLGGPSMLRAIVGEEIATRALADASLWTMIEVLAPTISTFGSGALVAEMVPPFLRGDELWCQGFSEPGTGSDLASLACRATPTDGGWLVNGQKVWTSFAQYSERCVLLTRTGDAESRHRGITALFIDMDSPGITTRPIETQHGRPEFAEVFYDDVFVPEERLLGAVDGGWKVAMDILPYERSTTFWHRGAVLHGRCAQLVEHVAESPDRSPTAAQALGQAFQSVVAFRSRSRDTQYRLAEGGTLGAETSVDKILIASAEQELLETARGLLGGTIEFDDGPVAEMWRVDYLYSKAATIYGGTGEIQRNIVANRLLELGREA
ncbi:MAG: acyl-CoA dehydrogenase family protein [Acidimicrobiales bacterium]|nr:acyl-CoA dehydrogenase family protein [Acidimicrobiales bacterium]